MLVSLLVALLGRQAATHAAGGRSTRPLMFGGALAAGAAAFMLSAGLVIPAEGEALFARVRFEAKFRVTIRHHGSPGQRRDATLVGMAAGRG